MGNSLKKIILNLDTRSEIAQRIAVFMQKGICQISFDWSVWNPNPLKVKKFRNEQLFNQGQVLEVDIPGPFNVSKPSLLRIPFAIPEDGRYFPEGTEFYFTDSEIYAKCIEYTWDDGLKQTYGISKMEIVATVPYQEKDQVFLNAIEEARELSYMEESCTSI
jgi:hypothetical protein